MNKGALQQLANYIIDLAVEKTNSLVLENDPNEVRKEDLASFLQKLRAVKNKGKQEMLKTFMGGDTNQQSISIDKFIEHLLTPTTSQLLTLQGIRKFLKKQEITAGKFAALTGLKKPAQPAKEADVKVPQVVK